jgi:HSP20 family protein
MAMILTRELAPWRPFRELTLLPQDTDAFFSRFFADWGRDSPARVRSSGWYPAVESYVEGDKLIVRVDLPGIDPKEVEILVVDNQLIIKGERKATREHNGDSHLYREVHYGRFERTLPLPKRVSADNVNARYNEGVLEISMPASKGMTEKRIPIESK